MLSKYASSNGGSKPEGAMYLEESPDHWRNIGPYHLIGKSASGKYLVIMKGPFEYGKRSVYVIERLPNRNDSYKD